jgi:histidyl-tRNA synthetase
MRPNLFDTVKYALNTMVKYNMAYYTNTPYETSLQNSNNDLHDLQIPKDGS